MIPLEEAVASVLAHCKSYGTETVELENALGRVLVKPIYADRNYPPFNRACMDGFAIKKSDWDHGIREFDVIGTLLAGGIFEDSRGSHKGVALKIMTGAATPSAFDAIIKIEDSLPQNNRVSFAVEQIVLYQNIAREGEDIQKQNEVLGKGMQVTLGSITALASVGAARFEVVKMPRVTIVTTGSEILNIESTPLKNQIRNSNAITLKLALRKIGIDKVAHHHVSDDLNTTINLIEQIMHDSDIILFTGGVSAGSVDFVPDALQNVGFEKLFHKIKIKPGKPAWFGVSKSHNNVVFALPGNPLSVLTTYKLLVEPYILSCTGRNSRNYEWLPINTERFRKVALDEFFPVVKVLNGYTETVNPVVVNGSGDITATLSVYGLAQHPIDTEKLNVNTYVKVFAL